MSDIEQPPHEVIAGPVKSSITVLVLGDGTGFRHAFIQILMTL